MALYYHVRYTEIRDRYPNLHAHLIPRTTTTDARPRPPLGPSLGRRGRRYLRKRAFIFPPPFFMRCCTHKAGSYWIQIWRSYLTLKELALFRSPIGNWWERRYTIPNGRARAGITEKGVLSCWVTSSIVLYTQSDLPCNSSLTRCT